MLKACGAVEFSTERGSLWAVFDEEFQLNLVSPEVEGTAPALTCRSCDVDELQIRKDTLIEREGFKRKVMRIVTDGAGETVLLLKQ